MLVQIATVADNEIRAVQTDELAWNDLRFVWSDHKSCDFNWFWSINSNFIGEFEQSFSCINDILNYENVFPFVFLIIDLSEELHFI